MIAGRLIKGRVFLDLRVGICDLFEEIWRAKGQRVPKPVECRGLIDTSRLVTTVSDRLLESLGIREEFADAGGKRAARDKGYCMSVVMDGVDDHASILLPRLYTLAHAPKTYDAAVVIGVDALKNARLTLRIDWPTRSFTLDGPSPA